MKLLLFIVTCVVTTTVSAQVFQQITPPRAIDGNAFIQKWKLSHPDLKLPQSKDSVLAKFKNYFGLGKKPGVYSLKMDNMPCIVPDTKEIAEIPNFWRDKITVPFNSRIPNRALPQASPETK